MKTIIEKSPLKIPKSAVYEVQKKPSYTQIKIKYKKGEYEYIITDSLFNSKK